MIRELFPRTAYEKESLLKGFVLFFVTVEVFLLVISVLLYREKVFELKSKLFLEMKNYSYTFEGEKFGVDLVSVGTGSRFYELFEGEEGLYILVPIPGTTEDALKILYPADSYRAEISEIKRESLYFFALSSLFSLLISFGFSLYAINPLRKALDMIEEVTKDILHDLNTPLMTIGVNLKMIRRKYDGDEVRRAELAVRQLQMLRDNLRPLERERILAIRDIELGELVEKELTDLRYVYPEISVKEEIGSAVVRADETAVRRIVSNILDNAFRHTSGRWVRVVLTDRYLLVENPSQEIKDPQRLFERYFKTSQRGLGLGLSIVRRLCDELGWNVRADYREGVFSIKVTFR